MKAEGLTVVPVTFWWRLGSPTQQPLCIWPHTFAGLDILNIYINSLDLAPPPTDA